MYSPSPYPQKLASGQPNAQKQPNSASASPLSEIWIFHLNAQGIIQFCHRERRPLSEQNYSASLDQVHAGTGRVIDLESSQKSSSIDQEKLEATLEQWRGQSLTEVVKFSGNFAGFDQVLEVMGNTLAPVKLQGTLVAAELNGDRSWLLHPFWLPNGDLFQITAVGYPRSLDLGSASLTSNPGNTALIARQSVTQRMDPKAHSCNQLQVYAPRLNQITRNIRWTLDLETIRRRTVDGLGKLFGVQRCLVCSYDGQTQCAQVAAEYRQAPELPSWMETILPLAQTPYLAQAATSSLATRSRLTDGSEMTVLSVATRYQNQINGFVLLFDRQSRNWSEVELGLITDLADQVGTAITHARLFGESHALAIKLQHANVSLMEKQREFQEAQRQAEEARRQAEEASRLKSEFLANTSHELRTPLNGMIGFLKLVLDGMADDPEEQQEFIQEAHKSALHLLNLINDVLDIAKIEAGKMQIDMAPVNLKELLADVENFSRPQAEQKGLYFNILIPATRDEITLNGNYQRLLQVLLNLVSNAVKFTHEGGITISAEVKSQRVDYQGSTWPGTVKVSVADTGIGVSLEKQDRLFQTFSQVDGERTRQYGGTGLGLAISQKLVEAMGGVVQFISMGEGLGSTVTFTALLYQEPVIIDKEPVYPSNP